MARASSTPATRSGSPAPAVSRSPRSNPPRFSSGRCTPPSGDPPGRPRGRTRPGRPTSWDSPDRRVRVAVADVARVEWCRAWWWWGSAARRAAATCAARSWFSRSQVTALSASRASSCSRCNRRSETLDRNRNVAGWWGMNRQQLRAAQTPLKERYRGDSAAAVVTLTADGALSDGITCSVQTGRALAVAGLHPASGGDGMSLCSGDMLLQALAACAGVTLRAVATSLDLRVRGGSVHVEGDVDFRGTLAVDRDAPVGFRAIRVTFELDTDADNHQLKTLLRLTERYC